MKLPQTLSDRTLDTSVPVLVLKIHHGSLGIARSLGRLGVPMYALTDELHKPATLSRYWQACYPWDVEKAPEHKTIDFLLELGRELGRRAILIAVSDRTAELVADHAQVLRERFMFPKLAPKLVRNLTSKKEMYGLVKTLGIATAETSFPKCRADVLEFLRGAVFPVMLKGIHGARLYARTGCHMAIVRSSAELLEQYDRLEDLENPNLMLQEYIPGGEDSVWMFNGYFNATSECLVGFTGKKIRQNPVAMGSTSLGICLRNEAVDAITRKFMKAVGYQGILDIGYRYDARDGSYKVLDVNPRIGSTFRLFVDTNGLDVVRALYRDLTGQPVPKPASTEGRKWCAEDQDLESFHTSWQRGNITVLQWLMSFRGLREGAWFARDDMRPFRAICRIYLATILRALSRKLRPFFRVRPRARGARP